MSTPPGDAQTVPAIQEPADTTPQQERPPRPARREWPKSAVRVTFGVIWLVDASLKWMPKFRHDYLNTLQDGAKGQLSWLNPWFTFWIDLQRSAPHTWAYLVAVAETLIAVALILGFARKVTYIIGAVFSLLIWATAEGFGGPYTTSSTDVGAALIYAVVFVSLLVISAQTGPSRYSVDYLIERRWPGWARVAEVRHP
jgi:nitrite reductase (NO-forming)